MIGFTRITFTVDEKDGTTILSVHCVGRGRGLLRLLDPLLGNRALRSRKDGLLLVKELLESRDLASDEENLHSDQGG
jgi:hypothetical protein